MATAADIQALNDRIAALEQSQTDMMNAMAAIPAPPTFDTGDTAWLLTSTALVLLMTLPGLALFYGGMAQVKNVLSTVFQTFSIACLITILWFMMGYSLAFIPGSPVIGGSTRFWLIGAPESNNQYSANRMGVSSANPGAPTIPESVFMTYQLTFAIITAAIVCGSFAERMKFSSMLVFIFLWHFLVYCFVAHAEWAPDGFLYQAGTLDFAGGDVVHICSGVSGLAASIVLGPRKGFGTKDMKPHNVVYTMIGGSLLWVGWFGFNAGSALGANGRAGFALMVTQICAGTSGFTWMILEYLHKKKASVLGIVSGAVAGLVIITPAAGYVDQTAAFLMGIIGTPLVYLGIQIKHYAGYDDALDAFGVHAVGGAVGGLLTGLFANDFISGSVVQKGMFYARPVQLGLQLYGIVVIGGWSFFMSFILLKLIQASPLGLRVSDHTEEIGLDISEHGESMVHNLYVEEGGKPATKAAEPEPAPAVAVQPVNGQQVYLMGQAFGEA